MRSGSDRTPVRLPRRVVNCQDKAKWYIRSYVRGAANALAVGELARAMLLDPSALHPSDISVPFDAQRMESLDLKLGTVVMGCGDGETELRHGDAVIIPGMRHSWRTGTAGATLSFAMAGLVPPSRTQSSRVRCHPDRSRRERGLDAPFADLAVLAHHPVDDRDAGQVDALIQQDRPGLGRGLVRQPAGVEGVPSRARMLLPTTSRAACVWASSAASRSFYFLASYSRHRINRGQVARPAYPTGPGNLLYRKSRASTPI